MSLNWQTRIHKKTKLYILGKLILTEIYSARKTAKLFLFHRYHFLQKLNAFKGLFQINYFFTDFNKIVNDFFRGLNISDAHINVNYRHVSGVYVNVATINKSNIHFSKGIQENLNIEVSKIALLITDQPVVSSDYSVLSPAALVLTYNNPCGYREENLIVEMALSDDGLIDFSRCFVPVFNETDIDVSPCKAIDDRVSCTYKEEVFIFYLYFELEILIIDRINYWYWFADTWQKFETEKFCLLPEKKWRRKVSDWNAHGKNTEGIERVKRLGNVRRNFCGKSYYVRIHLFLVNF